MEGQRNSQDPDPRNERKVAPATTTVDVIGELSVLGEAGEQLRVFGHGEVLSMDMPSLRTGSLLVKKTGGRSKRRETISRLQAGLRLADLTLQLQVAGRPIASLSPHSEATLLSRLLGLGAMELRPLGLLLAIFRR